MKQLSPQFKTALFLISILVFGFFTFISRSEAAEIYTEFGIYHYLGETDRMISENPDFGGDTYSIIEIGVSGSVDEVWYFLYVSEISFALHHLSHPDRGQPFNDNEEAWLNGIGVKFRWNLYEF